MKHEKMNNGSLKPDENLSAEEVLDRSETAADDMPSKEEILAESEATADEIPSEEGTVGTEINKTESGDDGDEKGKKSKNLNIFPKIVCVLLAVILWYYVMQVDSPDYEQTFEDVPVTLTGTTTLENERSLFVYSGYGYTVDVTVNGKKSVISKYTLDDIKVTADLVDVLNAGEHNVTLGVTLPTGLSLVKTEYEQITVYADEKASIDVPIKAKLTGANYNNEYEYGELVTEYNSVIVTGPKTVLATVGSALASVDLSGLGVITETTSAVRPLVVVGKSGEEITNPYIKLSRSEVKVTLPVYTEKVVSLTVDTANGLLTEKNSRIKIQPSELRIKGDPAVLSGINTINVATLDEKKVEDNVTYTYELEESDKYTYLSNNVISVTVTHVGTVTKTYSVTNITVNAGDNEYRLVDKTVDITLRGTEKQLEFITADDIKLIADVSEYSTDYSGTVSAEVEVVVSKNGTDGVYEIGTYRVQIRVNDD